MTLLVQDSARQYAVRDCLIDDVHGPGSQVAGRSLPPEHLRQLSRPSSTLPQLLPVICEPLTDNGAAPGPGQQPAGLHIERAHDQLQVALSDLVHDHSPSLSSAGRIVMVIFRSWPVRSRGIVFSGGSPPPLTIFSRACPATSASITPPALSLRHA